MGVKLLRRPGDVESSVQTEPTLFDTQKRKSVGGVFASADGRERIGGGGSDSLQQQSEQTNATDSWTQVVADDLPDFESTIMPHIHQIVQHTMEQAFIEVLEEEELKEIRRKRMRHLEAKMAELTTSRLINVPE